MSANNSTPLFTCPYTDWYFNAGQTAAFLVYDVLTPIYGVLGTLGHSLCLIAFLKQAKSEKAYMYQFFSSVSELLEVIFEVIYAFTVTKLAGAYGTDKIAYTWYRSCYICMFWSCYLGTGVADTFLGMSVYFAVAMSLDRFYALWKPMAYRNLNTKRQQIVAVLFCVSISILTTLSTIFEYRLVEIGAIDGVRVYAFEYDTEFVSSTTFKVLVEIKNGSRALALLMLYISNIGLILIYRVRKTQAQKTFSNKNEKKRKEVEKTLTQLAISQACIVTVGTTCLILAYTADIIDQTFFLCKGSLFIPLVMASVQFTGLCEFISVFIISKQFRKTIYHAVWCCKNKDAVSTIQTN